MSIVSLCLFCYGYTSPTCSNSAQDFLFPQPSFGVKKPEQRSVLLGMSSRKVALLVKSKRSLLEKTQVYIFLFQNHPRINAKNLRRHMSKKHAEEKSENSDCLKRILSSIGFLTRQGISFVAKNRHQSD